VPYTMMRGASRPTASSGCGPRGTSLPRACAAFLVQNKNKKFSLMFSTHILVTCSNKNHTLQSRCRPLTGIEGTSRGLLSSHAWSRGSTSTTSVRVTRASAPAWQAVMLTELRNVAGRDDQQVAAMRGAPASVLDVLGPVRDHARVRLADAERLNPGAGRHDAPPVPRRTRAARE
jgi:hypothetical protein